MTAPAHFLRQEPLLMPAQTPEPTEAQEAEIARVNGLYLAAQAQIQQLKEACAQSTTELRASRQMITDLAQQTSRLETENGVLRQHNAQMQEEIGALRKGLDRVEYHRRQLRDAMLIISLACLVKFFECSLRNC